MTISPKVRVCKVSRHLADPMALLQVMWRAVSLIIPPLYVVDDPKDCPHITIVEKAWSAVAARGASACC